MICIRLIKCCTQCSVPSEGNQAGSWFFFIFTPFWSKHNWQIKCISQVVHKNICDAVVVVCTENDLHSRYLDHLSPKKIAFLYVRWEYLSSVAKFQAEEKKHGLCVVCWLPEVLLHLIKAVTLQPTFPHHSSPSGTSDNYLAAFSEYNLSESTYRWDSVVYVLLWLLPLLLKLEVRNLNPVRNGRLPFSPFKTEVYDVIFISYLSCCCDKSKIKKSLSFPGYGPSWQESLNVMSSR